ncbi:tetratricopeptide repeat protein [Oligoflexus tunisiensis]|uniref:tetratricopeptide repeat protein n=1 Tax=Oligoflexus tunisiensis TaxID=708132 RepID=UPI00114D2F3D|nr:tetratricopeptide repeat protein [Oligoflexus tunisiensis]
MRSLLILTMTLAACASEPDTNTLDDVSLPPTPAHALSMQQKPENMDPQQIFDWQRYYKRAPNAQEQKAIVSAVQATPPATVDERLRQARNVMALGRRQEARRIYEDILRDEPDQIDAQLELTHLYLAENNVERAFDYLTSIRKILGQMEKPPLDQTFRYRYALALTYIQSQNRKKGHDILTELLQRDPGFLPAYGALAQSYLEQEKLDVAEFIGKRGLDKGRDDPRLTNLLAVIALRRNRLDDCKAWLQKTLAQNPDYVPALINRANLAIQRREYAVAENDLQRAATLEPLNSEVQIALGLLMKRTGRISHAKVALEKAVELDPQNAFARYHLGVVLSDDYKDRTGALQLFYDVLQADEKYSGLKNMAKVQIEAIRDSRLYE